MLIDAPPRRVVTGLDEAGRSCILFDGLSEPLVWQTDTHPVDNSGTADKGAPQLAFPNHDGHSSFAIFDFPPTKGALYGPGMHVTNTIDYFVVISGEVVLVTETGETLLRAGDVGVDRGIVHAWRNDGEQTARLVFAFVKATPVYKKAAQS